MTLLIDGYNLLHASGIFPSGGPPTLERSRTALLDFLAEALPAKDVPRATVVFDAAQAPPGLPRELEHRGLKVRFARRGGSADELLEELIADEPDPRHLLVVSSDHRVQRAARQRGASFTDSEPWQAELAQAARSRADSGQAQPAARESEKEAMPMSNPFPPGYGSDLLDEPDP
jgi:predicted RNA-binding protein with PIN domain